MRLAKLRGWTAQLLDYRNTGNEAGGQNRAEGGAAMARSEDPAKNREVGEPKVPLPTALSERQPQPARILDEGERRLLLDLARRTLNTTTTTSGAEPILPQSLNPVLLAPRACFVTLSKGGVLRGCIGHLFPKEALYLAVIDNARNAALRDPRFPPLRFEELPEVRIEISVLTEPQPLLFSSPEDLLSRLHPHQDGVVLRWGSRMATFLPQVWEQIPDKVGFLNRLSEKAGCESAAWRGKETSVSIYHVECFAEGP